MTRSERGGIFFKLVVLLLLAVLALAAYLLRGPLLRAAGEFWVVDDPLQPADAIVALSDDDYLGQRAVRTAELYHAGWAPRVVASGRRLRPYVSLADFMQRDLVERGVPATSVIPFSHFAYLIEEEAGALRQLVTDRGWHRVLIVTSNYNTRRTRYIFRRVFPPNVEVRVSAARDSGYDPERWWRSRTGMKLFFRETGLLLWSVWQLHRSEAPPAGEIFPAFFQPWDIWAESKER